MTICAGATRSLLAVFVFGACGRLELGSYADMNASGSDSGFGSTPSSGAGGSPAHDGTGGGGSAGRRGSTAGSPSFGASSGAPDLPPGGAAELGGGSNAGNGEGGHSPEGGAGGGGDSNDDESPSCRGLAPSCGPDADSCCTSLYVPSGTFRLGGIQDFPGTPGDLASFYLDKYEVTVGRFRNFIAHYDEFLASGALYDGAGRHPLIAGTGWQSQWRGSLRAHANELAAEVDNCFSIPFSTLSTAEPNLPMNCISWFEAFAFCVWDGGRLATEAEWEYAAEGGGENRIYPWGDTPEPSHDNAVFDCGTCLVPAVGSKPLGAGNWGHLDQAGSMAEWGFDGVDIYPNVCSNCANIVEEYGRSVRGGSWFDTDVSVERRTAMNPTYRLHFVGTRCAR